MPAVAVAIAISGNAGRDLVTGKDLPIAVGKVLESSDVVLQEADTLLFAHDGTFALASVRSKEDS